MDKQNNGFKELPDLIKSVLGLITSIIGFILLFQSNLNLSILVSSLVILGALYFLCIYVVISRKKSEIIGGGSNYRFPRARKWALFVIVLIPAFMISILFIREARSTLVAIVTNRNNQNEVTDCGAILGLSKPSSGEILDDKAQILSLIEIEADSVVYRDISQAMSIFRDDSRIEDTTGAWKWEGCRDIELRYTMIIENTTFVVLWHNVVELKISGNTATAETILEAIYHSRPNAYDQTLLGVNENSEYQTKQYIEKWNFVKEQGIWKVKTFVYGLPLP